MTAPIEIPQYLLLLPPAPWPVSPASVRAAYRAPLLSVMQQLSFVISKATIGAKLDIAVSLPPTFSKLNESPRSILYPSVQRLVSSIYRLICVISTQEKFNVEDAEGIDVRVLLISPPTSKAQDGGAKAVKSGVSDRLDAIVELPPLASSQRSYQSIFTTDSEECEQLLRQFLINQDSRVKVQKVRGGDDHSDLSAPGLPQQWPSETRRHLSVAVGGTWDHLHIGHKLLLTMVAFLVEKDRDSCAKVTVGITGDELLKNKKHLELLQAWEERRDSVFGFLKAIMDFRSPQDSHYSIDEIQNTGPNGHITRCTLRDDLIFDLVEISDPFGPTITDEGITALVLSAETRSGGKAVNEKRNAQDWSPLQVFEVDVLEATEGEEADGDTKLEKTFESKISSTSIRESLAEKARSRMST